VDVHKLRADYVWGMIATIQFRILCIFVYLKTRSLKYTKQLLDMGVKLGSLTVREENGLSVFECAKGKLCT
jgi:hypothetical protein